ncbi:3-dehydroshikimate dehydratase [Microbacterium foliorum]|uniref:3-dehydroshikimate dehydratase n=1 Tax=Microbacterium foliorum TaxID=104336 RepID=A0ABU1HVI1_9MICO|nr:TIM barrel protein [Microbacterium foliorum]MDR6144063.1 3-dehydroshikimate dehydratase [Microbacterium foliorum]
MTLIRPGLCSVTFRALAPEQIVDLVSKAALEVIEWGGDVHVPAGDVTRAERVASLTADAGLKVASYGSYFGAGIAEPLTPILDSAEALGADRIRIWAGGIGSAVATDADWAATVTRLQAAASEATSRGIALALEFHSGTLADTAPTTLRLLDDVGHPALSTYWQPSISTHDGAAIAEYEVMAKRTTAVHVFSWWPKTERLPLSGRASLWTRFFAAAQQADSPPRDALLEFVPGDQPELLATEADALLNYLGRR